MPVQLADQTWKRDLREVRQVTFTVDPGTKELSAVGYHQFRYTEQGSGEVSWESGPAVEVTQAELLACHPQAAAVLAALTALFHSKVS
jgi:hypothetical protein